MKQFWIALMSTQLLFCCSGPSGDTQLEDLVNAYYQSLNDSDDGRFLGLHFDSVRIRDGDYQSVFSLNEYKKWLEWDAVFNPVYEVLEAKVVNEAVEVTVSKKCKRILFLNHEPVVNKELITFQDGKVYSLEILSSSSYNDQWIERRERLVSWIKNNHPRLDGFVHDQTKTGGLKYLKALEFYEAWLDAQK